MPNEIIARQQHDDRTRQCLDGPDGVDADIYRPRQRPHLRQRISRRIQAMGIRDPHVIPLNGHVERLIGSIRRECSDHLIVLNNERLRRILQNYPPITMGSVLMFCLGRMHRTGARASASETSSHMQSWAGCITGSSNLVFRSDKSVRSRDDPRFRQ